MKLIESRTLNNLARAYAGECQARVKYEFIEYGARKQGYKALAEAIDKIVYNEFNHARMFYTKIQDASPETIKNLEVCAGYPFKEKWDLEQNLKFAMEDEETEVDLYLEFYDFNKADYLNYLETFKLPLNKKMHTFSKGMKRQVFVSLALAIKPKYLFLDEAFDGLDPLARLTFKRAIIDLVEEKQTTIIISSHSLRELEDICDCYGLIDKMEIASSGDISESIDKTHKYQVAFNEVPTKDMFNEFNILAYEQESRIVRIVVNDDLETFKEKINKYNPLIIDEIPINFEELFIIEVENRGYLKWKIFLTITSKKDSQLC